MPASIRMIVTPPSVTPSRSCDCNGVAPRYNGNRLGCTLSAPHTGISSTACGTILPYDATAKRSGALSRSVTMTSRNRSGSTVAMPSSRATTFTGVGWSFWPRPDGRSGWVTTSSQCARSANARSAGTAKSLVPKKTPRSLDGGSFFAAFPDVRPFGLGFGERGVLFFRNGRTDIRRFVDVEHAVEMVHLVLQATTEKTRSVEFDLLAGTVETATYDALESASNRRSFPAPKDNLRSTRSRPR